MKNIIIFLLLTVNLFINSTYANIDSSIANKWFTSFSKKIHLQYSGKKEIEYFEILTTKLNKLSLIKKLSNSQVNLIDDLIKLSNEYVFIKRVQQNEQSNKSTLSSNSLLNNFKYISYNKDNIFKEKGIWYAYQFNSYSTFPSGSQITKRDLEYNDINPKTALVFITEDNSLGFVKKYKKIKLISDFIIYGIAGKYNFLVEVKNDKKKIIKDTDTSFLKLKLKTKQITKGKTREEKIKAIYAFTLNNVEYTQNFELTDYRIFSGIDTFNNKDGVCEGYTKLFLYMLNFSNIANSEVIRGYVIDARDFPKIGHAWLKIGDKYYDPTFDDPIGQSNTKEFFDYKYYGLPKNLLYLNRYEFDTLPQTLKKKSLDFRKRIVDLNTTKILKQYKNSNFNLLKPYILKLKYNIPITKSMTIDDLSKILKLYEVRKFKYGDNKNIKTLKYYKIDDDLIDTLLNQLNYNLDGYYLFKWIFDNGTYEYRLAYDIKFQ